MWPLAVNILNRKFGSLHKFASVLDLLRFLKDAGNLPSLQPSGIVSVLKIRFVLIPSVIQNKGRFLRKCASLNFCFVNSERFRPLLEVLLLSTLLRSRLRPFQYLPIAIRDYSV